jgi:transcriptional regulator with XRE-family HTH domain
LDERISIRRQGVATKEPTPTDRLVGARIRQRRTARGMSQESLAEAVGVSVTQIQKYERGADRIGAARLYGVAVALSTNLMFFFAAPADSGDADDGDRKMDVLMDRETTDLALAFNRIHEPEMRRAILALVQATAERGRTL